MKLVRLLTLCTSICLGVVRADAAPPNIVFVLVDDLGWSDLGSYGHPWHLTPHIDHLAQEGMRYTDAYSPAPICSAARASILTGKAVPRLGFEFVTKNAPGHQQLDADVPLTAPPFTLNLPLSESTIAERLSALDYHTAFFGKWHLNQHFERRYLAWHPEFGPRQQGFLAAVEDFGGHPYSWGKRTPSDVSKGEFAPDSMIERIIDYVRSPHERPFFLMASFFYVHTPIKNRCRWLVDEYDQKIPEESPNREQRLEYAAFVQTMDHHVGLILDAIDAAGFRDDTIVVLTSDNGGHPEYTSNAPLRGSKWNLYEGGIRVPLIVRWPGHVAGASTCATPVIGYDLLPTCVELAGGSADGVDGVSFAPTFHDPEWRPDRRLIWHFPYYHPERGFAAARDAIGVGDFAVSKTRPHSALRSGDFKLLRFDEDDRIELYDLSQDLSEQTNLALERPLTAANLRLQLDRELDRMHARRATRADAAP